MNLGRNIQAFIPQVQEWAENIFQDNKEIVKWIGSMAFKWDEMIKSGIDFFKNGAGSVLGSTFEAAKSIVSGVTTFFIAFVFACYILPVSYTHLDVYKRQAGNDTHTWSKPVDTAKPGDTYYEVTCNGHKIDVDAGKNYMMGKVKCIVDGKDLSLIHI